ncbi:hypothetical protein AB8B21_00795 [Tardiphaga sp. 866_E4_N2_1]|uniref:hypothetical protein n=1 Tax=unclassified Tardiphaga TaxID=2631404 RepID=UPI003F214902
MGAESNGLNEQDSISVMEGFEAVRLFLRSVLRRRGKQDDEIDFILGGLMWGDGAPNDPLMWDDWLAAIQSLRDGQAD